MMATDAMTVTRVCLPTPASSLEIAAADVYGRHVVCLNATEGPLRDIAQRLRQRPGTAGLDVSPVPADCGFSRSQLGIVLGKV